MEATLRNPKEFTKILSLVSSFDVNFNMKCTKAGIDIFCMDRSKSSIVSVDMPSDWFSMYNFTCKTDCLIIGMNVTAVLAALKSLQKNDMLNISCKENTDKISVTLSGAERQLEYDVKMIHVDEEELSIPEVKYNLKVSMTPKLIKNWKSNITDHTGNHITFTPLPDTMQLKSDGDDASVTSTMCQSETFKYITFNEPQSMGLSPNSIAMACKIADLTDSVEFGWMNQTPINVKALLDNKAEISMWFAPVIKDMDEMEED